MPWENIITFVLSVHVVHLGEDNLPFKNNTAWGKIIPKGKNYFCKDCDWIRSQELLGRVHKRPRSSNYERPPPIGFTIKKDNSCDFRKCNEDDIGCVDKVLV